MKHYLDFEDYVIANQDELENKITYNYVFNESQSNQIETISQQSKNHSSDELGVKMTILTQDGQQCNNPKNKSIKILQKKIRKSKKNNLTITNNHDVPYNEMDSLGLDQISACQGDPNLKICTSIDVKSLTKMNKQSLPKKEKNIPKETKNIPKNFASSLKSFIEQNLDSKLKSTYCIRKFMSTTPNELGLQQLRNHFKKNQLMRQLAEHFFGSCGWVRFFLKNNKTDLDMYFRHLDIWNE